MKKLLLSCLICFAATGVSLAQEKAETPSHHATTPAGENEIAMTAVPENVQVALERTAYKAEDVTEIFELTVGDEKHYKFIINTTHGKRAVVFDANGTMQADKKQEE